MARIRSIHPGIWTDEAFVSVSRDARLLFIGILNESDDHGAFEWKPLQIKMKLCAGDDAPISTITQWLAELEEAKLVRRYCVNGSSYGAVRHFRQWQRPKKPTQMHPMPKEEHTFSGLKPGHCVTATEPDDAEEETGSPPVPHQSPTDTEKPPQMDETLGNMEEDESANADSGARDLMVATAGNGKTPAKRQRKSPTKAELLEGCMEFQDLYPDTENKAGELAIQKAWIDARKTGVGHNVILDGLRCHPFKAEARFVVSPVRWLKEGRWTVKGDGRDSTLKAVGATQDDIDAFMSNSLFRTGG